MKLAVAPTNICVYRGEYLHATMDFFEKIEEAIRLRSPIRIDFSQCETINAAAAVMTFAKITRYQLIADFIGIAKGHQSLEIQLPQDKKVRAFFRNTGFHDAIRPGGKAKLKRLWDDEGNPFKTSNSAEPDLQALIKHLKNRLGNVPDKLMSALTEGYLNINHHAYDRDLIDDLFGRWWQYTSSVRPNGTFSVVLYDSGIGIPRSLEHKLAREVVWYTDNQVIEYAMQKGSTRYGDHHGRGNGFHNIKKPVDINKQARHLFIASGRGTVTYKDQRIDQSEMHQNYGFGGTLIEWCFDGELK